MDAFRKLNKGIFNIHPFWTGWIQLLVVVNGIISTFFFPRIEAVVMFAAFVTSALAMTYLTHRFGFARILGLAHFLWIPALIFLAGRWSLHPANDFFGWWLRGVVILDVAALVLDVWDVSRWLNGDRAELVENL